MSTTSGDEQIVVGIDGSPHSTAALTWAVNEARLRHRRLRIVHAFPAMVSLVGTTAHEHYPQVEQEARDAFEAVLNSGPSLDGLDVDRALVRGNPAEQLVAESEGANLLVVGSRGLGAFRGMLLGSVSMHCVNQAHCPVVVVRGDEAA